MAVIWLLLGAAIVAVLAIFFSWNTQAVSLYFPGISYTGVPLWIVVAVTAIVGLLIGFLVSLPGRVRSAFSRRRLAAQLEERERTVAQLQSRVAELERDVAVLRAASSTSLAAPVPGRDETSQPATAGRP